MHASIKTDADGSVAMQLDLDDQKATRRQEPCR